MLVSEQVDLAFRFNPLEHRNARGEWARNGAPAAVFGDPATARHIAVFVPGTGSSTVAGKQDNIERAKQLKDAMDAEGRGSTATMMWGYRAPDTIPDALHRINAESTAGQLRDYVNRLKARYPAAHITVVGHSYGSTVAGMATRHGMKPDDLVFVGSPGVTVRHASELGISRRHIWAGDEHQDPVGRIATALSPDFHGNPDHLGFGALRFQADNPSEVFPGRMHGAAHSSYFHPASQALGNMAAIATGHYTGVTRATDEARLLSNDTELAWHFNPLEPRDAHGQWSHVAGFLDRAASAAGTMLGPGITAHYAGGEPSVYSGTLTRRHELAELDWQGHMHMARRVADLIQANEENPHAPVDTPAAYTVPLHEMFHSLLPAGENRASSGDEQAMLDPAHHDIEEGFTELGTIQHAAEFFDKTGLADRLAQVPGAPPGTTMRDLAEHIDTPESVKGGEAWGRYPVQTAKAYQWAAALAEQRTGKPETDPATQADIRKISDEINAAGTIGKIQVMARLSGTSPDAVLGQFTPVEMTSYYDKLVDLTSEAWRHEERDSRGRWTHIGGGLPRDPGTARGYRGHFEGLDVLRPDMSPADGRKPLDQPGRSDGAGTPADPVDVRGDMGRAVQLMASGQHVRLNSPAEIGPLLDEVNRQAAAQGYSRDHEPDWDLGNVSVKGTRLFNEQTRGIPRIDMPQLAGPAQPGSEAALLAGGANRFIELDPQFREQLRRDGVDVRQEKVPAGNLRATQTQLTAATVAGITAAARAGNAKVLHMLTEPIWVSADNYVIDGHHRWASDEALAFSGHGPQDINIQRIGLPIALAVPYARAFAEQMGVGGRALGNAKLVESANRLYEAAIDLSSDAWEHELRDDSGKWYHGTSDVHAPGTVINPAVAHRANFDPEHSDPKSVYIAGSVRHAMHYAERDKGGLGDPHVYEVEPLGEHWPIAPGSDQHQTRHPIRIIREVST